MIWKDCWNFNKIQMNNKIKNYKINIKVMQINKNK